MLVIQRQLLYLMRLETSYPSLYWGLFILGQGQRLNVQKTTESAIIGTEGTVKSGAYEKALMALNSRLHVKSQPCPKFVPLVESGEYDGSIAEKIVAEALKPLQNQKFDTLILGCTHYPLLEPLIQQVMGEDVTYY